LGGRKGIRPVKNLSSEVLAWLEDFRPMEDAAQQSPSLHMELCDLQADSFMQGKRGKRHLDSEEFWQLVSEQKNPKLNDFALHFYLLISVKKLNSLKHLVRTTVAGSHN